MQTHLKHLPLEAFHISQNAQMAPFAGFYMPTRYTSDIEEHHRVRTQAGLFDVSHMGEALITGKQALEFINYLVPKNIHSLKNNQACYTCLLREDGTTVEDIILYRFDESQFWICLNASNIEKDILWINQVLKKSNFQQVQVDNISEEWGQLAIQGPFASQVLQNYYHQNFAFLKPFYFTKINNHIIARTGYTGEDGFEIFIPVSELEAALMGFLEYGKSAGLGLCGLACRDTLRLEAGLCLYGNDLDDTTTLAQAGLLWTANLDKANFIGKSATLEEIKEGPKRILKGVYLEEPGILRRGYAIFDQEQNQKGVLTSGGYSPTLKASIGLGYVDPNLRSPLYVSIRNKNLKAKLHSKRFYIKSTGLL